MIAPFHDSIIFSCTCRHRRLAVRDAWARQAQVPGVSVARFIMSADEHTTHVQSEVRHMRCIS